jgi:hypothetical protein
VYASICVPVPISLWLALEFLVILCTRRSICCVPCTGVHTRTLTTLVVFRQFCGWFSLLVCSLCMVITKRVAFIWNVATALCTVITLALGTTFALLGHDNFQVVIAYLGMQFTLAAVVFFLAALVMMLCFSAVYWRFFRCGRKVAPLFIYKLKRVWRCAGVVHPL